jgi:hypothetical protein
MSAVTIGAYLVNYGEPARSLNRERALAKKFSESHPVGRGSTVRTSGQLPRRLSRSPRRPPASDRAVLLLAGRWVSGTGGSAVRLRRSWPASRGTRRRADRDEPPGCRRRSPLASTTIAASSAAARLSAVTPRATGAGSSVTTCKDVSAGRCNQPI